jgi:protein-tyrosine kinase
MQVSLVERAAKRLEELGRAASQVSGDLTHAAASTPSVPSLIERAARKVEGPDPELVIPEDTSVANNEKKTPSTSSDTDVDRANRARREPKLGDVVLPLQIATGDPPKTQRVELDVLTLSSAGYLQPEDSESEIANEFRKIKRPLIKACQGKSAIPIQNANRIMVTSSVEGEGKSFVAFNLALSIAMERDSTVLLIDADTTRPRLSQLAGIQSKFGLLDLLTSEEMAVSNALFRTNIEKLTLLPAGTGRRHATELLASAAMERLVEHLAGRYSDRILIFDAPPLLGAPEPAVLASHMGQIIVVVEADKTTHKVLTKALTTIQSCPVVTTVLNKASSTEQGYFYAG